MQVYRYLTPVPNKDKEGLLLQLRDIFGHTVNSSAAQSGYHKAAYLRAPPPAFEKALKQTEPRFLRYLMNNIRFPFSIFYSTQSHDIDPENELAQYEQTSRKQQVERAEGFCTHEKMIGYFTKALAVEADWPVDSCSSDQLEEAIQRLDEGRSAMDSTKSDPSGVSFARKPLLWDAETPSYTSGSGSWRSHLRSRPSETSTRTTAETMAGEEGSTSSTGSRKKRKLAHPDTA